MFFYLGNRIKYTGLYKSLTIHHYSNLNIPLGQIQDNQNRILAYQTAI